MKNLFLLLFVACCSLQVTAQINLDSLLGVWNDQSQPDSSRLQAIHHIAWYGYVYSQPDSGFYYAELQFELAEKSGSKKWMASALNTQGVSYCNRGNYPKGLEYLNRASKLKEEIGDKRGVAATLGNIASIYIVLEDHGNALDYYQRSLQISKEVENESGIAIHSLNLGTTYLGLNNETKALEYYQLSLKKFENLDNKVGIAYSLTGLGSLYLNQDNYSKALDYFQRSIELYETADDKYGIAFSQAKIAEIYLEQGKYQESIKQCVNNLELAQNFGDLLQQKNACECLYVAYKATGNGNKALEYHEQMLALDDSLQAEETAKQLQQMEFQKQVLADSIASAEESRLIEEAHLEEIRQKKRTRNIFGGVGFFALLLAGGFYWRWRYVGKSKAVLQVEKDRSENLLLNILPEEIAEELKEKGRADARDFEMVSILFTDFKGFTAASEKLSAQDLVSEINTCFEAFDGIMGKYGIEKIKTIGDAYMAAGGLPVPSDDSVKNTVLAALEMQDFIKDRKAKLDTQGKPSFEMRVGVHTGPVVAGIVGVKKFQYDIWGDTVNTASRMESSGEVGRVNISEVTYELLKDDSQFSFESRGKVAAKGKGEMEMHFVEAIS